MKSCLTKAGVFDDSSLFFALYRRVDSRYLSEPADRPSFCRQIPFFTGDSLADIALGPIKIRRNEKTSALCKFVLIVI